VKGKRGRGRVIGKEGKREGGGREEEGKKER
jgi:hypothetical protein